MNDAQLINQLQALLEPLEEFDPDGEVIDYAYWSNETIEQCLKLIRNHKGS